MDTVVIDGSTGEGGGQILRTAFALSAITQRPLEVHNIRAKRPKPGLRPQHLVVARAFQEICDGKLEGAKVGSSKLCFTPGDVMPGAYEFDVGTAGSVTLVLQALLPAMIHTGGRWNIRVRGGTDTQWSPSWDYFNYVFLEHLSTMGVKTTAKVDKRGFYPKGGGDVSLILRSSKLAPLKKEDRGDLLLVAGKGFLSNLPLDVWERMKAAMLESLIEFGSVTKEDIVVNHVLGSKDKAVGVTLWTEFKHARLGYGGLGAKGVKAEDVGSTTVAPLIEDIAKGATVDMHSADQLLPYMALAPGRSVFHTREITGHCHTNMDMIKKFLDVDFQQKQEHNLIRVSVEGVGI